MSCCSISVSLTLALALALTQLDERTSSHSSEHTMVAYSVIAGDSSNFLNLNEIFLIDLKLALPIFIHTLIGAV